MSRTLRRYEVLLPLRFNDGLSVPDEVVADTLIELEIRFGAVSCETQTIRGYWRHEDASYRDDLIRVFVDVADEPRASPILSRFQGTDEGPIPAARPLDDDLSHRGALTARGLRRAGRSPRRRCATFDPSIH